MRFENRNIGLNHASKYKNFLAATEVAAEQSADWSFPTPEVRSSNPVIKKFLLNVTKRENILEEAGKRHYEHSSKRK